ncbi:MAG: hypothetical protein SNG04_08185 [Rikenellaceae bacterium]
MSKIYKSNNEKFDFFEAIKKRDQYTCVKCGRTKDDTTLRVQKIDKALRGDNLNSNYITLCNSCNAKNKRIIEPTSGWDLIFINDLGSKIGTCERKGCGTSIRYEHHIYHPDWGNKIVGSTCVDFLTEEDKYFSDFLMKTLSDIRNFIKKAKWIEGITQKTNNHYIETKLHRAKIRLYELNNQFSYQLAFKDKGVRNYKFEKKESLDINNISIDQAKELCYIIFKAKATNDERDIEILREIYRAATRR